MNDATSISVAMNSLDEVLPALPHLIGFYPAESLVIVTLHKNLSGKAQLGPTLRADLPTTEECEAFVALVVARLNPVRADALMLFVVTDTDTECADILPHGGFVGQLTEALDMVGTPVEHALWTSGIRHGAEWISYLTPGLRGTVGDPRASVLGAAQATQGSEPFASRDALRALIAPSGAVRPPRNGRSSSTGSTSRTAQSRWLSAPRPLRGRSPGSLQASIRVRTRCCGCCAGSPM